MSALSEMAAFLSVAAIVAFAGAPQRAAAGDLDAVQTSLAAPASELDLALGRALFERAWVSAPASTRSTDGLGPLYNARSCAACHGGGQRPLVLRLIGPSGGDPVYGAQLQTASVHGLPAEGQVQVTWRELPVTLAT